MGCGISQEAIENRRIEKWQQSAAKKEAKMVNLLLIGSGDSGKTTLRKQITNVHNEAFAKPDYRKTFIPVIVDNLVDGTVSILNHLGTEDYKSMAEQVRQEVKNCDGLISPKFAEMINFLLCDDKFRSALLKKRSEVHLQECYLIYVERLTAYPTWGGKDWVPSADECIRARTRTSGIVKEVCQINDVEFCIIDVGGQRAERRKWLHVFEDVTAAIFVAALSDYDQNLFEDATKNRMEEALDLYSECVNSQWLFSTSTLLFLNKQDVFERKFLKEKIPLNISGKFPGAPQGNENLQEAMQWVASEFTSRKARNRKQVGAVPDLASQFGSKDTSSDTFVHFTTATDPQNVKTVFQVSANIILKENLKRLGFDGQ